LDHFRLGKGLREGDLYERATAPASTTTAVLVVTATVRTAATVGAATEGVRSL
jgi:hypothetical protein